jgi:hypothetical protein
MMLVARRELPYFVLDDLGYSPFATLVLPPWPILGLDLARWRKAELASGCMSDVLHQPREGAPDLVLVCCGLSFCLALGLDCVEGVHVQVAWTGAYSLEQTATSNPDGNSKVPDHNFAT